VSDQFRLHADSGFFCKITRSARKKRDRKNLVVGQATPSSHKHIMSGRKRERERERERVFHKHTINRRSLTLASLKTSCHLAGLLCPTEHTLINVHHTHSSPICSVCAAQNGLKSRNLRMVNKHKLVEMLLKNKAK